MSAKHTPGRLSVDEYPVTLANGDLAHAKLSIVAQSKDPRYLHFSIGMVNFSAEFTGLYPSDVEEAEANARRLVACWNACEGMATDELEEIARTGGMLGPREDVAKIAEQRDKLRDVLLKYSIQSTPTTSLCRALNTGAMRLKESFSAAPPSPPSESRNDNRNNHYGTV